MCGVGRRASSSLLRRFLLRAARPALVFLANVIGGGRGADRYLGLVPVAVVLQGVENVLRVGVDQVGPGLPERVYDVVDEADLVDENKLKVYLKK